MTRLPLVSARLAMTFLGIYVLGSGCGHRNSGGGTGGIVGDGGAPFHGSGGSGNGGRGTGGITGDGGAPGGAFGGLICGSGGRGGGGTGMAGEVGHAATGLSFLPAKDYTVGSRIGDVRGMEFGDLNGDAKTDIVVTTSYEVNLLMNNGEGAFPAEASYVPDANPLSLGSESAAIGDLNGDGWPDLAVAVSDSTMIGNNGSGGAGSGGMSGMGGAGSEGSTGGMRGALSGGTLSVLLNTGNGTFAAPIKYVLGTRPHVVALGDLNGDGKPDVVLDNYDFIGGRGVSVLLNNGNGTFAPVVYYGIGGGPSVAIGDLNGDGSPDLVTANQTSTVSVVLNNGNGTFGPPVSYDIGRFPTSLALGDLNGDSKADLVVTHSHGVAQGVADGVAVLLNSGNGTFSAAVSYAAMSSDSSALGDLNGDGKPDVSVAHFDGCTGKVGVLLNHGDGSFASVVEYPAEVGPIGVGDFNGDGKLDLVTATGINVSVLLNATP